jgi:RNA polymerase sigma factor (TIGR02999 family)
MTFFKQNESQTETTMQKRAKHDAGSSSAGEITLLLSDMKNPKTLDRLMRLTYDRLHQLAAARLRHERSGHSLQATELVDETCLRLITKGVVYENRAHFFGAASKAMRRILVEAARRRGARKRGGGWHRIDTDQAGLIGCEQESDLLDFNSMLTRLEAVDPGLSKVVELRIFGGWSWREIADILEIAESTARRRFSDARNWLRAAVACSDRGVA